MTYPINYPTPQDCDVQIFYGVPGRAGAGPTPSFGWVKPKGASFVWFTLIGAGGRGGDSGDFSGGGGGSGAVTNCLMPAFLVPDELRVSLNDGAGAGLNDTRILYQGPQASAGYLLLRAGGGNSGGDGQAGTGGEAVARSAFAAAGFYQSIVGQAGGNGTSPVASPTTFLSGGTNDGSSVTPNYGYPTGTQTYPSGFFQMSPIIVGRGGANNNDAGICNAGVGCGGGGTNGGFGATGGAGMVVIISW